MYFWQQAIIFFLPYRRAGHYSITKESHMVTNLIKIINYILENHEIEVK